MDMDMAMNMDMGTDVEKDTDTDIGHRQGHWISWKNVLLNVIVAFIAQRMETKNY